MHSPSPQLLRALRTSLFTKPSPLNVRINSNRVSRVVSSLNASPCATSISSPAFPLLPTRRNNSSVVRPMRMIPRAHSHKPTSHDRGPQSKEETQTDFAALDVLGNIPAPTTAVDACLDSGFHLNSGVRISGGDALLLVGGEAFSWRPWKSFEGAANEQAAKAAMINAKGQFELHEQAWGLLSVVWPRPGACASLLRS